MDCTSDWALKCSPPSFSNPVEQPLQRKVQGYPNDCHRFDPVRVSCCDFVVRRVLVQSSLNNVVHSVLFLSVWDLEASQQKFQKSLIISFIHMVYFVHAL